MLIHLSTGQKKKVNKDIAERWKLHLPVLATTYPLQRVYFQQFLLGTFTMMEGPNYNHQRTSAS